MIANTLRLGHQTPQEILVAYMCAGRTVDDDGYYYDEETRSWQKIPELVEAGFFAQQTELPLS